MRFLIVEILLPLLLFAFVRSILRELFGGKRPAAPQNVQPRPTAPPPVFAGGELKKDPVCGTYVSTGASLTRTVNGELLHFCSNECRDKYRAA